jgi:hypothetical protein
MGEGVAPEEVGGVRQRRLETRRPLTETPPKEQEKGTDGTSLFLIAYSMTVGLKRLYSDLSFGYIFAC